ncbi:D-glycero-beta-D-manno-heptose 1,7-bisphosphate 7-phosphatase [Hydromonas duriensis]|uniref:D,D-heptose 1,7-bisphosphate phosphatase n=1 Tax=Hydromonas duriensis TaxID=1527608 RepID=A0A4R6YBE8_9BURK|nr:D-glycero-beta-D-manno-heptose 1,7-bisphosphate 7-phosphatase [Hydromonas duriensis]TDR32987.1 D-glycero-D-manno-heptose 1,7-bisphosphate phosphatase [Hydromonas duriensis]
MEHEQRLIILSRDGVINEDRGVIATPDDWVALPDSLKAIARLNRAHFRVVVATNQPGIMQGKLNVFDLNAIHKKMHEEVEAAGGYIEAVFFCPHTPDAGCSCRKPSPTMLQEIADRFEVPLNEVIYVGDTINDMNAAQRAGCQPFLVLTGQGNMTYAKGDVPDAAHVRVNLAAVVKELVGVV